MKTYIIFSRFLDTHARNILLVDDTPSKSIFDDSCSVIFLESFEGSHNDGDYLFSIVLPYLLSLQSSKFCVHTYIKHIFLGLLKT
jgi:hypothetical protein